MTVFKVGDVGRIKPEYVGRSTSVKGTVFVVVGLNGWESTRMVVRALHTPFGNRTSMSTLLHPAVNMCEHYYTSLKARISHDLLRGEADV